MEFKKLGDCKIPILGIGTWGMGGWFSRDTSHDNECIDAIRTAVKSGMTHIDTAEIYGNGHAEEIVGKAIKGIPRKKLFITTKVAKNHLHYNDVLDSARKSMKRMNIKYIDLYLIHSPNQKVSLKETMSALDYLVERGLVRFIGVSNFSSKLLREAQSHAKNKIVANQVEYNLLKRDAEKNLLGYCQKNGVLLIAYQPLALGKLAHKGFRPFDEICLKYDKTPAQVALNWLISKQNVIAIPKASARHVRENLGALGWKIRKEDAIRLERYFWKFGFISSFAGRPIRLLKDCIIMIIPEKYLGKFEGFYDRMIEKISKLEKRIFKMNILAVIS